jgi:hypothetical protein
MRECKQSIEILSFIKKLKKKHCRNVNKKKIINYINWENSLESNMPKKYPSFNFNLNILFELIKESKIGFKLL